MVTLALLFPIMRAMGDTGVPERFIGCVLGTAKGPRDLIFRSLDGKTMGKSEEDGCLPFRELT